MSEIPVATREQCLLQAESAPPGEDFILPARW